jgi:hypothetical protein
MVAPGPAVRAPRYRAARVARLADGSLVLKGIFPHLVWIAFGAGMGLIPQAVSTLLSGEVPWLVVAMPLVIVAIGFASPARRVKFDAPRRELVVEHRGLVRFDRTNWSVPFAEVKGLAILDGPRGVPVLRALTPRGNEDLLALPRNVPASSDAALAEMRALVGLAAPAARA